MKLEDKKYGTGSTTQEIEAIKKRVYLYGDNIVIFNQLVEVSSFSTELLFEEVKVCVKDLDSFTLIIDLSKSSSPDAEYRAILKKKLQELKKLKRVVIIARKYSVLAVTARFIALSAGLKELVVREDLKQALEYLTGEK